MRNRIGPESARFLNVLGSLEAGALDIGMERLPLLLSIAQGMTSRNHVPS